MCPNLCQEMFREAWINNMRHPSLDSATILTQFDQNKSPGAMITRKLNLNARYFRLAKDRETVEGRC